MSALSPTTKDDAIMTTANAQGEVRRVTENSELSALAGVTYLDYSSYSGQEDLTNEDLEYGDLRGEWRGDRVTWQLSAFGAPRRAARDHRDHPQPARRDGRRGRYS